MWLILVTGYYLDYTDCMRVGKSIALCDECEILKFVQAGILVKNASISCCMNFFSSFLKPTLVSVYQRYGSYCHNFHCCGKKQVILETDLPILQGELGRWNYLILKFPNLNVLMWQLKLVTIIPSAEDLSGLLNPSLERFSPVHNVKRYCRKACFNALPAVV